MQGLRYTTLDEAQRAKHEYILKGINFKKGDRVLDIGCGWGPMLQAVLAKHKVPYTAFKYAENTGQMAPIREQAGTFADSIKLWSAA